MFEADSWDSDDDLGRVCDGPCLKQDTQNHLLWIGLATCAFFLELAACFYIRILPNACRSLFLFGMRIAHVVFGLVFVYFLSVIRSKHI